MVLGAVVVFEVAPATAKAVSAQISTVIDPAGDALFHAPAFQDFVFGQMTKTAGGDFELLMEMAGPIPVDPPLPSPANSEIWWAWGFDLDPTAFPRGYPSAPGAPATPEFLVYVSWDGTEFAGSAVDRRPLLTGGQAIITPVQFNISGMIVHAVLPAAVIANVPPSFPWYLRTIDYSGPIGSAAFNAVDSAGSILNP
jgi:hypothetical protein